MNITENPVILPEYDNRIKLNAALLFSNNIGAAIAIGVIVVI